MDPAAVQAALAKLEALTLTLEARLDESDKKVVALEHLKADHEARVKAAEDRIAELEAKMEAMAPPDSEPALRWARRWRIIMLLGALLSPSMALGSLWYRSKDALAASKLAWASYSLIDFSSLCALAAALGNVRNIGSRVEKVLVVLCGLLVGTAFFFPGYALAGHDDEETATHGKIRMGWGILFAMIFPPIGCKLATMWSALEDKELSVAVTNLFKTMPYTLGSIMYLAAATQRCTGPADDQSPLIEQCGNPLLPTKNISGYLVTVWVITNWVGPVLKAMKAKTWKDVLLLRMTWMEGLQFCLFIAWSTTTWITFANLFEEGSSMTPFVDLLRGIFIILCGCVLGTLTFDIFIKPRLCPSSATASSTTSSVSNADDNATFGIGQMGAGVAVGM